jgi:hypothetical protein
MKRIWIIPAVVTLLLAISVSVGDAQAKGISGIFSTHTVVQSATLATYAFGLNSKGDIVGTFVTRTGSHGYLLHDGTYTRFDVPAAANFTEAKAINAADDIVGDYADSRGNFHGFLRHDNNTYTTLDVPGPTGGTFPYGITNAGDIAGFYTDARTTPTASCCITAPTPRLMIPRPRAIPSSSASTTRVTSWGPLSSAARG